MKFFIANDDGINADGIKTLANVLAEHGHKVMVIAPTDNRSGFSHSLSVRKNMAFFRHFEGFESSVEAYSLDGTPADCIKFASYKFSSFKPDMVLSGINLGANLGIDIMYSGTVGAAMEGANQGFLSVAISLLSHELEGANFKSAAMSFLDNIEKIQKNRDHKVIWNINVPNLPYEKIKGTLFTKIGKIRYDEAYSLAECEQETYYLGGSMLQEQSRDLATDVGAVMCGYTSITPILIDRTGHDVLEGLA